MRKYLELGHRHPSPLIRVPALGIREEMPRGLIHHGGAGSRFPYLLMLFHSPAYVYEPSGRRLEADNRAVLWDEEAEHRYGNSNDRWNHSWLHFEGQTAKQIVGQSGLERGRPFVPPDGHVMERYLELLYDELQKPPPYREAVLEGLIKLILLEAVPRMVGVNGVGPVRPFIFQRGLEIARRYLEECYTEPFDLDAAAEKAGLSRAHFSSRFAERFGIPPREYIIRLRLHRAEKLLCNPDLHIAQAATLVGYEDPLYFSRLFHKRYGCSPRTFRNRSRDGTRPPRCPR